MVFWGQFKRKEVLSPGVLLFLLLTLGGAIYLSQRPQELREKAATEVLTTEKALSYISNLGNEDYSSVESAVQALLSNPQITIPLLVDQLNRDSSVALKGQAIFLLGKMKKREAVPQLMAMLPDPNAYLRMNALAALGEIGDQRAVLAVANSLSDTKEEVRQEAAIALGKFENSLVTEHLLQQLEKEEATGVKAAIVSSLGRLRDNRATSVLTLELDSPKSDKFYKDGIIVTLGEIGDPSVLTSLRTNLSRVNRALSLIPSSENPLIKGQFELTKRLIEDAIEKIGGNRR